MGTFSAKAQTVDHQWVIVDAENQVMGRLASMLAKRLRGKHLPVYTPHVDTGDFIVLVNVEKMRVTGNKAKDKIYYRHTEHPGGIKSDTYEELMAKDPRKVLMKAVKGMLPKGPLGRSMLKKLKVYVGPDHPHQAQQPREVKD